MYYAKIPPKQSIRQTFSKMKFPKATKDKPQGDKMLGQKDNQKSAKGLY